MKLVPSPLHRQILGVVGERESDSKEEAVSESARHALAFIEALIGEGLRDFVVSPGSRSTPLVLALQHFSNIRIRVILDERSAGFFALGVADRTHRPVGLICTSGTAAANYYPAVIEASERGVPLLLLTADRPAELRDCGAGQTIDQVSLFGKYVRWEIDASAPSGREGERYLSSVAREGLRHSRERDPGPVHFNLPFREPFLPAVPCAERKRVSCPELIPAKVSPPFDWQRLQKMDTGIILVGAANPAEPHAWADGIFRLSDYLGWPVFADVLNPLRQAAGAKSRVVTQYEGLVSGGIFEREPSLRPNALLQIGILPTAKPLRQWLANWEGKRWQWTLSPKGLEPSRKPFEWIEGDPSVMGDLPDGFADGSFRDGWMRENDHAVQKVSEWMEGVDSFFEGRVYHEISRSVSAESQVFIANSMPVRDAERYWFGGDGGGQRIFSNRGASGIDGLVSMVAGLADDGHETVAVLGDLSFLHDAGGLKVASQIDGPLTLVIIDNGGGHIFGQLPIRSQADVFEKFFLTPQQVDLEGLCRAHGIEAKVLGPGGSLKSEISTPHRGVRALIIRTDPAADQTLRGEWKKLFRNL